MQFVKLKQVIATASIVILTTLTQAQVQPGYVLVSAMAGKNTILLDTNKNQVHQWNHSLNGGYSVHLTERGTLIRPCSPSGASGLTVAGGGGMIEEIDKDGEVLWSFTHKSQTYVLHHDVEPMPNGNVLAVAQEVKTAEEATALGFPSSTRATGKNPEKILEIAPPNGSEPARIVWEWHAWDHFVASDQATSHPELLSVGLAASGGMFGGGSNSDFMHMNGLSYNDSLDLITFSCHYLNEIYVIDHSTTTEEAASHAGGRRGKGGDLLYRWGSNGNYDGSDTEVFDVVHCAVWIPYGYPGGGHIMALNNMASSRNSGSIFTELVLPLDASGNFFMESGIFGPSEPFWTYNATGYSSSGQGSLQRLPNGNTIMATNGGNIREVTNSGAIVWEYTFDRGLAQIQKYPEDFKGVKIVLGITGNHRYERKSKQSNISILNKPGEISILGMTGAIASLYTINGKEMWRSTISKATQALSTRNFVNGTYFLSVKDKNRIVTKTVNITN